MRLGNLQFNQMEEKLGYRLEESDKMIWDKYHNNNANLDGMGQCFHVFDIPRSIVFRGEEAKQAILTMFTKSKLVNPCGEFGVGEQK